MHKYVARRLLSFVPALFGASLLIFVLMRVVPGDIAEILVYQAEGFHFVDTRVRGYKFAPTVYDNNTFMKVWLAQ